MIKADTFREIMKLRKMELGPAATPAQTQVLEWLKGWLENESPSIRLIMALPDFVNEPALMILKSYGYVVSHPKPVYNRVRMDCPDAVIHQVNEHGVPIQVYEVTVSLPPDTSVRTY